MPTRFSSISAAIEASKTKVDPAWVASGARKILTQYGSLIEQYRGDVPASLGAARIWSESRGNVNTAPSSTDEVGLLQVWNHQAERYGIADKKNAAQNLFAGFGWWNLVGDVLRKTHGFTAGTPDFWHVTYVALNIGRPLTSRILDHMKEKGHAPGPEALEAWVKLYGEDLHNFRSWMGTQTPDSVAWRIMSARRWVEGAQQVGAVSSTGLGQLYGKWGTFVPTPGGGGGLSLVDVGMLAAGGYLVWKMWGKK